jgi:hypothetical protein
MKKYSRIVLESMLDSHRRALRLQLAKADWPSTLWSDKVMATLDRVAEVKKQLSELELEQPTLL